MSEKRNALPFDCHFVAVPKPIVDLYVHHKRFTPTVDRVYRYLLMRYNSDHGYAWPSWNAMQRDCAVGSRETIQRAIDTLKELELINVHTHENEGSWNNCFYTFRKPIDDPAEFERRFGAELKRKKKTKAPPSTPVIDVDPSWL